MILNDFGMIANNLWSGLPKAFDNILLDINIIMPNHMHGIIAITEDTKPVGDAYPEIKKNLFDKGFKPESKKQSDLMNMRPLQEQDRSKMYLSKIIQIYKSKVTRKINNKCRIKKIPEIKIWQRSFYDRIIRNEKEFCNIQQYIFENPIRWQYDIENTDNNISDTEYYNNIFNKLQ